MNGRSWLAHLNDITHFFRVDWWMADSNLGTLRARLADLLDEHPFGNRSPSLLRAVIAVIERVDVPPEPGQGGPTPRRPVTLGAWPARAR